MTIVRKVYDIQNSTFVFFKKLLQCPILRRRPVWYNIVEDANLRH